MKTKMTDTDIWLINWVLHNVNCDDFRTNYDVHKRTFSIEASVGSGMIKENDRGDLKLTIQRILGMANAFCVRVYNWKGEEVDLWNEHLKWDPRLQKTWSWICEERKFQNDRVIQVNL